MSTLGNQVAMFAGNKKVLRFTVYDYDTDATGETVMDLTGYTAKWSISKKIGGDYSATPALEKDGVIAQPTTGIIEVTLDEADTDALLGFFHHELEIFDTNDGDASTVVHEGDFHIKRNVVNT